MNEITITVDERLILAICDAALRNQGVQILSACNQVISAVQNAKANGAVVPERQQASMN